MKSIILSSYLACALSCFCTGLQGAGLNDKSADANIQKLQSPNDEVRIEALRSLLTSLDSRVPEAVLPLLSDKENSIRRLAVRAVGSRWWQIPKDRVPVFIKALQHHVSDEFEDEKNMDNRAIGLLTRNYEGNMFARSSSKRWVIYERHNLPCLLDSGNGTEELLGWAQGDAAWIVSSWGNAPTKKAVQ